jgi:ribose 5-phosphate isomerase B
MKVALGCDHFGLPLRQEIASLLSEKGIDFRDYGPVSGEAVDYPDVAERVATAVRAGEFDRGILICGTGVGMAIAANKIPGIRAAVVHDPYSAERSRKSNNAQVLAMGALVIGPKLARHLVSIWLEAEFQGGESIRKVEKISQIEARFQPASIRRNTGHRP